MRELPVGVYIIEGRDGYRATIWDKSRKTYQVGVFDSVEEAEYKRLVKLQGHHWTIHESSDVEKLDPKNYWGFTYLITNKKTGKMYVGKKQFRLWDGPPGGYKCTDPTDEVWFDESMWRPNDWEFYTGSQKDLNNELWNPWDWKFEVLTQDRDKLQNHLSEVLEMMERNVLEALDENGEYLYYNKNIAGLEFRAPFLKRDMKAKQADTMVDVLRYYNRPALCPKCEAVIPYPGTGGCKCS